MSYLSLYVAATLLCLTIWFPAHAKADDVPKKPLPAGVSTPWEKAGATIDWGHTVRAGLLSFADAEQGGKGNRFPLILLPKFQANVFRDLPQPDVPFGLIIAYASLTDKELAQLSRLNKLEHLSLRSKMITDNGLKHLKLPNIITLYLDCGYKVSDASLSKICEIASLQGLSVCGENISNKGFVSLSKLKQLRELDMGGSSFSGSITDIKLLSELESLHLHSTNVTDEAIAGVINFPRLRVLTYISRKSGGISQGIALLGLAMIYRGID